jgi:hypothetical protein
VIHRDYSIHDTESVRFMSQAVSAGSQVLNLLRKGLSSNGRRDIGSAVRRTDGLSPPGSAARWLENPVEKDGTLSVHPPAASRVHQDFVAMCYYITPEKWDTVCLALFSLLSALAAEQPVVTRDVTSTLGRVSNLHSLHGSVVRVWSCSLQYQLGQFVD